MDYDDIFEYCEQDIKMTQELLFERRIKMNKIVFGVIGFGVAMIGLGVYLMKKWGRGPFERR